MTEILFYALVLFFVLVILGWLIFLTVKYFQLIKKAGVIFDKQDPKQLSKMIIDYFEGVDYVNKKNKKIESEVKRINEISEAGLSKISLIRYNPFGDVGSDQSFSLCLLNAKNDGFVISSIHSRNGTRVYSKPIKNGKSEYNLSKEEEKVINLAEVSDKNKA